jgi:hypothetical protein
MSATSEAEICNLALTRLGHMQISNLDEGTKAADLCKLHYPRSRDAMLRSHPWNFAVKRATLALSTATPNHEFAYLHALPTDCLKVIRTSWEADGATGTAVYGFPGLMGYADTVTPYRIEGKFIACNETVVKIEYISRITDTAQFDDLFTDVLAQRVAAEICMALTDNQSAAQSVWQIYTSKLTEARLHDAQEGTPRDVVDLSGWIMTRR